MVNVNSINLIHNKLSHDKLIMRYFSHHFSILKTLPKLQILHVNNNSLYNLPVIGERCPLQSLDIRCNKIKELPENLFTKLER